MEEMLCKFPGEWELFAAAKQPDKDDDDDDWDDDEDSDEDDEF